MEHDFHGRKKPVKMSVLLAPTVSLLYKGFIFLVLLSLN
jgi:hypothetical protein